MLADFLRAFGGEALAQAAWGLAGLPSLLPCPALTGTELDPHAALHDRSNTTLNVTVMDTVVIPQEVQPGLVRQAAEGEAGAAAVPADPRQRQLGRDDSMPARDTTQSVVWEGPQSDAEVAIQPGTVAEANSNLGGIGLGLAGVREVLGPGSVALEEAQLVCIVQGLRLLVTLLREHHTWEPVS